MGASRHCPFRPEGGGCDDCRAAVQRCCAAMVAGGAPLTHAVEAAVVVYRWHRPAVPLRQAVAQVEAWTLEPSLN
jgi:hypothetical protein